MFKDRVVALMDFFYPIFRRIMDLQTYRYAVCGGINMVAGLAVYYIFFTYIFAGQDVNLGFYVFKAYVVALFISFVFNVLFGFVLMRFIVFRESNIPPRVQFFRYFVVCLFNLGLNYILLKTLAEIFHIYPTIAQFCTVIIVVLTSYIAQKKFSFATRPDDNEVL